MTDNLGSGIYLTRQEDIAPIWDLQVDNSGDIRTVSGIDELRKDISYSTAVRVKPEIGQRLEPTVLNRIRSRVRRAYEDEDRIKSLIVLTVNEIGANKVEVVAKAQSVDDVVELVFEVSI